MDIADVAVTTSAIESTPLAVITDRRRDAGVVAASAVVGFAAVPVRVYHVIVRYVAIAPFHFPHKPRISRRASLSCGPDAMIIIAAYPEVCCKQPTSALFIKLEWTAEPNVRPPGTEGGGEAM